MVDNVPIVDGVITYDFKHSHKIYMLIIRNALYIPTMQHNLIPLFLMRAGGMIVNDITKIHCNYNTPSDPFISFESNDFKIPLKLSGIFLYFYFRLAHVKELQECFKVFITRGSDNWNAHCEYFDKHNNAMTKFEDDIVEDYRSTDYANIDQ